jgi:hypothetical protein
VAARASRHYRLDAGQISVLDLAGLQRALPEATL